MPSYEIEEATLIYRWTFNRMLTYIPGPGSAPFNTLCRRLQPHGISPSEISLDAPSSRLSDVILLIVLFGGRVQIRVNLAWAEVFAKELADEDVTALFDIGDALVTALKEADEEVDKGRVNITYRAHSSLPPYQTVPFLHKYLTANIPNLVPDAFAYKLHLEDASEVQDSRLVVAKSLLFDNALYIDLSVDYIIEGEPLKPGRRFERDLESALALFELKRVEPTGGEGTA
jgi:hypothetical protein